MKIFKNLYKRCDHPTISFSTIYDLTIFKESSFLTHFYSFFGAFWVILGPKFNLFITFYQSCDHLAISFPTVCHTTLFKEMRFLNVFGPFLGHFVPFWGQKLKMFKLLYKNLDHLAISFSKRYNMATLKESLFLTLFLVPFWDIMGHSGPKNYFFNFCLQKLRSPHHKLSNDISYEYT